MVKKKEEIDNKYELIAFLFSKHWWKLALILIIIGFFVVGIKCDWLGFEKEGLKFNSKIETPGAVQ